MGSTHNRVTDWLYGCIAAFQFLSRIPIPLQINYNNQVFQRSVPFYPIVGGVIGLLLLTLAVIGQMILPPMPASVLLITFWIILTGGLHLDGLMDTADGILSHRDREQMLDIMKDSRVGAMGVIVCVLYLFMKTSLIYVIVQHDLSQLFLPLLVIPIWSRWFMTAAITHWPYARPDSGLGSFFKGTSVRYVGLGAIVGLLLSLAVLGVPYLLGNSIDWILLLCVIGGMLIIGCMTAVYLARKLGGLTGDTYGALNEILELTGLLIVVIFYHLTV